MVQGHGLIVTVFLHDKSDIKNGPHRCPSQCRSRSFGDSVAVGRVPLNPPPPNLFVSWSPCRYLSRDNSTIRISQTIEGTDGRTSERGLPGGIILRSISGHPAALVCGIQQNPFLFETGPRSFDLENNLASKHTRGSEV